MSVTIICHNCGKPQPIPDGYQRNKMRCSACGVICDLLVGVRRNAPEPRSSSLPTEAPAAAPVPVEKSVFQGKSIDHCPHCGELVRLRINKRKQGFCPNCGTSLRIARSAALPAR